MSDVFDLSAKLRLDSKEYEEGLSEAENQGRSFGASLKGLLGGAAQVGMAGLAASGAAVVALTKQSVDAYANYEQLVGGVQTLFGAQGQSLEEYAQSVGKTVDDVRTEYNALMEAEETVMSHASEAYRTAGLSANQYMETVTSFAASLVSSLEGQTDIAATVADTAVTDMADNANKMGTSMESIQNAYQGFAKQNYTMLDNLKLGYGGTKSEMERLLRDAEKMKGLDEGWFDINNFADIVDAIHIVQENMGITGTTAKEAAQTISGSMGMLKGSWDNLLAGLGNADADIGELVTNVVESAKTVLQNVVPIIGTVLTSLGNVLNEMAPMVIAEIPGIVATIVPAAINATTTLFASIASAIPAIAQSLVSVGTDIIGPMAEGMIQNAPTLIAAMGSNLSQLVASIMQRVPEFLSQGVQLIGQFAMGIIQNAPAILSAMLSALVQLVATVASNLPQFLQKGMELIGQIATGIIQGIPKILAAIPQVISSAVHAFTSYNWLSIGVNIIQGIINGIMSMAGSIGGALMDVVGGAFNGVLGFLGIKSPSRLFRDKVGKMIPAGLALGIEDNKPMVTAAMEDMSGDAFDAVDDIGYDSETVVHKVGTDEESGTNAIVNAIQGLADAISYMDEGLQDKFADALSSASFRMNGREFGRLVRDVS